MTAQACRDRILREVERATDEMLEFASEFLRIPTINPPGNAYPAAAAFLDTRLSALGFESEVLVAETAAEHTVSHPRHNIMARREIGPGPCLHFNGHTDVVPAGEGWTRDPWAGEIDDGRIWGRGAADMKCGLVAAIYAAEALRRAGAPLRGSIEISGTADEESGGFAGVAWLAHEGLISRARTDWVIIPEPFGPQRICVGHRGVLWLKIIAYGHIAHGSMPFLGVNAIDAMAPVIEGLRGLEPRLAQRQTAVPVVPPEARRATLNLNAVYGGQGDLDPQTPCVADRCELVVDRRFLVEEDLDEVRAEICDIVAACSRQGVRFETETMMVVPPVQTPADSPLVSALEPAVRAVVGSPAERVASPGTYDHKHVARIAGVDHCVAYGPGRLELAHQPDEYCEIADLVAAAQVMALAAADLLEAR